jgi:uncharacterized protein with FMN-binding domain
MKRAILVGTGTVAGVAAILALNPDPAVQTAAAGSAVSSGSSSSDSSSSGSSSSGSSSSGSSSSGSSSSGSSSSGSATDGTYTGSVVDVGRGYGDVQVEVTVQDGRIVDVTALAVPQNDPRSAQISDVAIPYLVQQALESQSADIAGVSGATYTARGFATSLADALQQAGL